MTTDGIRLVPAVILDAQRGGPSTGLPTKTEQSDLHASVYGGPGDSPRIVLAPTNVLECYEYTLKSFQIAEKYQTPVIILADFFLDNRVENIIPPRAKERNIVDGNVYPEAAATITGYNRYEATESGISPRAIPGMEDLIFTATGLEHSEKGIPNYTPENHTRMTEKRYRKIRSALEDLFPPAEFSSHERLDVGVIAWGSTFGSAQEAVQRMQKKGQKIGVLKVSTISPLHNKEISAFMGKCTEVLIPELNYEGQLANLIGHLHKKEVVRLNRVTGIPISAAVIVDKIEELL